ncbi:MULTISPECIES: mycofactocin oligosaccharide methyltransferase MftM [Gordonia]|uniref:mycofactocin oligosaccharide methyltransferase MftM n=1 Tax=Gordonia TaxID=2053 RepID=UPI00095B3C89|nr:MULTISPECIES: mycofactocin oligosaccharide methyltransferase MftM [Gordonia]MDH3005600.1 mycofactocin oligosaccharide methyltransferase MftM [Gordonia alkanivorans]MDH3010103.1 mycofactocin oligosaccharide methyltransferase MftM [Gordonia alkanivorans]MDH3015013.1 mycofactocin oligosaccharide methyltransferase MftM [Gordonia alkanivorans]MDH3018903.1 mycofactocin oligosaccharide methyltransferase MftM [Gordonia alkanivorans]MDH3039366.1 mycofactocin oligosaccharide methyltransferase MftM [G
MTTIDQSTTVRAALLDSSDVRDRGPQVLRSALVPRGFARCGLLSWRRVAGILQIAHPFDEETISDSVVVDGLVSLVDPGVLSGQEQFESAAVGIIRTTAGTSADAWSAFYDNSLRELRYGTSAFAPVHRRAHSLLTGSSVLEVGSCFGFFALACAMDGFDVSACDISPGAVSLLSCASRRLGLPVHSAVGDATALPYDDDSVDTVSLIHLLEHLDAPGVEAALSEALRVARRRVIVAVPFEEEPSPHFGHRLRLTETDLHIWAGSVAHSGAHVFVDHGGWLILTP